MEAPVPATFGSKACSACWKSKVKCDRSGPPCARCKRLGLLCASRRPARKIPKRNPKDDGSNRPRSSCGKTVDGCHGILSMPQQPWSATEDRAPPRLLSLAEDEGAKSGRAVPTEGANDRGEAADDSKSRAAERNEGQQQEQWVPGGLKTVNGMKYAEILANRIFALEGANELVEQKLTCAIRVWSWLQYRVGVDFSYGILETLKSFVGEKVKYVSPFGSIPSSANLPAGYMNRCFLDLEAQGLPPSVTTLDDAETGLIVELERGGAMFMWLNKAMSSISNREDMEEQLMSQRCLPIYFLASRVAEDDQEIFWDCVARVLFSRTVAKTIIVKLTDCDGKVFLSLLKFSFVPLKSAQPGGGEAVDSYCTVISINRAPSSRHISDPFMDAESTTKPAFIPLSRTTTQPRKEVSDITDFLLPPPPPIFSSVGFSSNWTAQHNLNQPGKRAKILRTKALQSSPLNPEDLPAVLPMITLATQPLKMPPAKTSSSSPLDVLASAVSYCYPDTLMKEGFGLYDARVKMPPDKPMNPSYYRTMHGLQDTVWNAGQQSSETKFMNQGVSNWDDIQEPLRLLTSIGERKFREHMSLPLPPQGLNAYHTGTIKR